VSLLGRSVRAARGPSRTDTESTLTSERKDTLKSPAPRREQRQPTVYEDEEQRCESPLQEPPRRRVRQETQDRLPAKKRPQSKLTQDTYDDDPRPARGPVGKTGPKRSDTARTERPRRETYDEFEEEEPRHTKGKGKAPQRDYRPTAQDVSDEEDSEEDSQSESDDDDDGGVDKLVAGAHRQAAAAISSRLASASAVGKSARKAAEKSAVGKNERLSIKLSKLNIKNQRQQQQQEEEEDEEEEEEEPAPPPPKKRRPKQPPQQNPYNQYGHHPSYAPDPYYGSYGGQYHGYHPPPPPPQHPNYYGQPPPPRYGPAAMGGFLPNLAYGMGNGTSSTVTMSNVGNDNSVHIITNKTSKRRLLSCRWIRTHRAL
jgi:hypothetical protein